MATPRKRVPNKLKLFRKRRGYSQKDVAEMLGHNSTNKIGMWERGSAFPGNENLFILSRLYRALPMDLFCDWYAMLAAKIDSAEKNFLARKNKPPFPDSS